MAKASLSLRIDFEDGSRLGPGKVALLEAIRDHGSIAAAARALGMSYRRAWLLVDSLEAMFAEPVVRTHPGHSGSGATRLTAIGERVVALYRTVERKAAQAGADEIAQLAGRLKSG